MNNDLEIIIKEIQTLRDMVNDLTQEQIKANWINLSNCLLLPEEYRKEILRGALITMKLEIPEQLKPTPNSAEQEFDSGTTTRSM